MIEFNFDMSQAPRGYYRKVTRQFPDGPREFEEYVSVQIIAAGRDGKTVTVSRWLPEADRWNMFSKAHPPIAWAPWPDHPGVP